MIMIRIQSSLLLSLRFDCCPTINIQSAAQPGLEGVYKRIDDFNGHYRYQVHTRPSPFLTHDITCQGGVSNTIVYYRKAGHGPDGWVVSMGTEDTDYILTTRDTRSHCPSALTTAYDQDQTRDPGFSVTCEVSEQELAEQDPGIPAAPLEALQPKRAISSSARDTLSSSAWFRILVIVYFIVIKLAEDQE